MSMVRPMPSMAASPRPTGKGRGLLLFCLGGGCCAALAGRAGLGLGALHGAETFAPFGPGEMPGLGQAHGDGENLSVPGLGKDLRLFDGGD